jgi:hypothetical protein
MIKVTDEMREIGVTPPTWLCAAGFLSDYISL